MTRHALLTLNLPPEPLRQLHSEAALFFHGALRYEFKGQADDFRPEKLVVGALGDESGERVELQGEGRTCG